MPDWSRTMSYDPENPTGRPSDEEIEAAAQLGDAIFEHLRERVWPGNEGKFIAIHVDTGEYAIGRSSWDASKALLNGKPPDGRMYVRKLSDEPDYALAARILAGEMAAGSRK